MTKITIGARGSKLSLAYVSRVKDLLIKNNKEPVSYTHLTLPTKA